MRFSLITDAGRLKSIYYAGPHFAIVCVETCPKMLRFSDVTHPVKIDIEA